MFKRHGYDPFIDFLKGVCILFVIFTHCFPSELVVLSFFPLWGSPAVPLFLIVQVFHTYKKGIEKVTVNFTRLWQRVVKPFFLSELVIVLLYYGYSVITGKLGFWTMLISVISWGGIGPGSYYPWVYVQFAILLPLMTFIFKYIKNDVLLAIVWVLIAETLEIICSIIDLPEYKYRLIFFRYTFLMYLGYILVFKGYVLNLITIFLSIISMTFILIFSYTDINLEPLFFCSKEWKSFHWICYIYVAYMLLYIIKQAYCKLERYQYIIEYFNKMGRHSYEIFLFQMFYFAILSEYVTKFLVFVGGDFFAKIISIPLAVIVCIVPVVFYKDKLQKR